MLPFHHVYGYTLFPAARQEGRRWIGIVRILGSGSSVQTHCTAEDFDGEEAAHIAATIEAATIANAIRTVG